MAESPKIPKLELDKFIFSPPGPMGWNMAEYEQMLENPDHLVLNETTVNSQLQSLLSYDLVELSLSEELKAKQSETMEEKQLTPNIEEIPELVEEEPEAALEETVVENEPDTALEETVVENELESALEETVVENEPEADLEETTVEEEEIVEEPIPKIKVTIIIAEAGPKSPWITPSLSNSKKKHK